MDEEIGPKHYRAASGRYLEEFSVGDIYEHHPGRTVSQQDNAWFTNTSSSNKSSLIEAK